MNYTRTQAYPLGNLIIIGMAAIVCAFVMLYIALVFETVSYTAGKQNNYVSIGKETADLGNMESKYVSLEGSITQSTALNLGFTEVSNKEYVSAPAVGLSFRPIE